MKNRYTAIPRDGFLLCALLAATGAAQGQSAGATAAPADDGLTFHGITLYGTVDLGLQYQTHGAPISDFYPAGSADIVQKNSNRYGNKQNSYGTGADARCSTTVAATCSGTLDAFSFDAVWRLTKHFDTYAGLMYTGVHGGLANGYVFHTTDMNPTMGARFTF